MLGPGEQKQLLNELDDLHVTKMASYIENIDNFLKKCKYSDSTLKRRTKDELIDYVRMLESNLRGVLIQSERQRLILEKLSYNVSADELSKLSNEAQRKIVKWIMNYQ